MSLDVVLEQEVRKGSSKYVSGWNLRNQILWTTKVRDLWVGASGRGDGRSPGPETSKYLPA